MKLRGPKYKHRDGRDDNDGQPNTPGSPGENPGNNPPDDGSGGSDTSGGTAGVSLLDGLVDVSAGDDGKLVDAGIGGLDGLPVIGNPPVGSLISDLAETISGTGGSGGDGLASADVVNLINAALVSNNGNTLDLSIGSASQPAEDDAPAETGDNSENGGGDTGHLLNAALLTGSNGSSLVDVSVINSDDGLNAGVNVALADAYDGHVPLAGIGNILPDIGSTLDLLTSSQHLFDVPALDFAQGLSDLDS
jgi:hypothetical protein